MITAEIIYNEWMLAMHGQYPIANFYCDQNDKAKACWENYTQAINKLNTHFKIRKQSLLESKGGV